jgi:hypothetical protein
MDKFDLGPIMVNIDKLKPYMLLDLVPKGLEIQIEGGKDGIIETSH